MDVLAYNLTAIDILTGVDEEFSTVLKLVYRVGEGIACLKSYHRAIHTACYLAFVWLVFLETVGHDGLAL